MKKVLLQNSDKGVHEYKKKKKNSNNILRESSASINESPLVCIFSKKPHRRHAPLN